MADEKKKLERIYTVNLSGAYDYIRTKRARRAVKMLREYLARHFKVVVENVKLSETVNSYVWRDSMQKPPRRVKVRGVKEDDIVHIYMHDEEQTKKVKADKKKQKDDSKKANLDKKAKKQSAKKEEKKEPSVKTEKKSEAKMEDAKK